MIVFDLQCSAQSHVFEAWFGSSADYEMQRTRQLIVCPICGDSAVTKAVMAPNVAAKGNSRITKRAQNIETSPANLVAASTPDAAKAMLNALAKAQAAILENATWVGRAFAQEARAIDAGESDASVIYGEATAAEAKALLEEGIGVLPLPLPVTPPEQLN